ncbi:MAG: hypothetical protein LBL65_02795 [Campylobacteraceae bacterium]|jgi:hypothetical protein|nr:hypothetical protein [Campylobacteraceae bacterium]
MKKLLQSLIVILAVGFLVSCGGGSGGGGGSEGLEINEGYYFPEFNIPSSDISHTITRRYTNANDLDDAVEDFKNKGSYLTFNDQIYRDDPIYGVGVTRAAVQAFPLPNYYTIVMDIDLNSTAIPRDDALFEVIFGYTNAPITSFTVKKVWKTDITAQLEAYGDSLVGLGFKKVSNRQWTKTTAGIMYIYGYSVGTVYPSGFIALAQWDAMLTY